MQIRLRTLQISNFKGCSQIQINLPDGLTRISGANATGKTTILDSVWWLLFNKDSSGSEKFEIRPLDKNGDKIHNVEISVFGIFEIERNGISEIISLKKSQSERWVTKRGTITAELQGNDTKYEINEFPKKESEYKLYINSLIDEGMFKMLSNPSYFPSLPWKEQREILMQMVSETTDYELASENEDFKPILEDLSKGTPDELSAKYRKEMSELKKQQTELPVRIDEVSKRKEEVDEKQLKKEREALEGQIAEIDDFLAKEDVSGKIDRVSEEITELKAKQASILQKSREEYETAKHKGKLAVDEMENQIRIMESQAAEQHRSIAKFEEYITDNERMLTKLEENRFRNEEASLDEYDTTCPYCGQPLPGDKLKEIRTRFEEDKAKTKAEIDERIEAVKTDMERIRGNYDISKNNLVKIDQNIAKAKELYEKAKAKVDALVEPDIPTEAVNINSQINTLMDKLTELKGRDVSRYEIARESLKERVIAIDKELLAVERNAEIDARVEELMEEQKKVAQRATEVEQKAFALEQFIRYKMDKLSEAIDSKFDGVHWKLFNRLINGGIEQCCECSYNGVGYKALNSGHQIIVGLKIIDALSKHLDCKTTIYIDNAETINSFNIPQMDTQMVLLKVTDEKKLVIT